MGQHASLLPEVCLALIIRQGEPAARSNSLRWDEEAALCSVISLGGLHLFVSPCEFGGKFGIQMREACPVEGLVFGYTNGYLEYWLPEEEYGLSFETQKSMVPKGDPEILVGKLIQASQLLGR